MESMALFASLLIAQIVAEPPVEGPRECGSTSRLIDKQGREIRQWYSCRQTFWYRMRPHRHETIECIDYLCKVIDVEYSDWLGSH